MCGIVGFSSEYAARREPLDVIREMAQTLVHRGPDAGGEYTDNSICLGHRRLSIIDLSRKADQPMSTADGRYTIVFNGEIYNFRDLRAQLERDGATFRTSGDTEVLLQAFQCLGIEKCLEAINGMFAFAIWDSVERKLFLSVDRLGKKPIYYSVAGGRIAFASELKAFHRLPGFRMDVELTAVADYFAYGYVPYPKSIFRGVSKLEPGTFLVWKEGMHKVETYWDVDFRDRSSRSEPELTEELYSIIEDAVKARMVSDVPLGAFLSGGVDSSGVVGVMSGHSDQKVRTCTIAFDDQGFDESRFARETAHAFGTDHSEFLVKKEEMHALEMLARHFDEPFGDSSFVPTFYVSRVARTAVTVALTGDGGDESFAGYNKYLTDAREHLCRQMLPSWMFQLGAGITRGRKGMLFRKVNSLCNAAMNTPAHSFFYTNSPLNHSLVDTYFNPGFVGRLKGYDSSELTRRLYEGAPASDHLSRVLYVDLKSFLPGDILVKADRMSMANSLELRCPLLDHRLVSFAASLPARLKLKGNRKKYLLREAFSKILPEETLVRPKHGFEMQLARELRGTYRDLVTTYLFSKDSLHEFVDRRTLEENWRHLCNGHNQFANSIWLALVFSIWYASIVGGSESGEIVLMNKEFGVRG